MGRSRRSAPASPHRDEDFMPIPVGTLDHNDVLACDLYQRASENSFVLLLAANAPFADELAVRLRQRHVFSLYVKQSEEAAYSAYLLRKIRLSTSDASLPEEQRAAALVSGTAQFLERAFVAPSAAVAAHLSATANLSLEMASSGRTMARHLLQESRKSQSSQGHTLKVAMFGTVQTASLPRRIEWQQSVAYGLMLHDIGKSRLPSEVLHHPGKFDDDDWRQMRRHPAVGEQILSQIGCTDSTIAQMVAQHHERGDGTGYPRRLSADQIAPEARLCMLADTYDALTTSRTYRRSLKTYDALQLMVTELRDEVEPELLGAFIRIFEDEIEEGSA